MDNLYFKKKGNRGDEQTYWEMKPNKYLLSCLIEINKHIERQKQNNKRRGFWLVSDETLTNESALGYLYRISPKKTSCDPIRTHAHMTLHMKRPPSLCYLT